MSEARKPPSDRWFPAGMSRDELAAVCRELGCPDYRVTQILDGLYRSPALSFDDISTLPGSLRRRLADRFGLLGSRVRHVASSSDGTDKLLVELHDGETIECVSIPEAKRFTCCLSSQVGCAINCSFCASCRNGLSRNLSPAEIVEQALLIRKREMAGPSDRWQSPHIVMMGVGEPLANYDNVIAAIRILNASWGLGIGARKFTISTVGLPAAIERLARESLQVNLAVSLHAPDDKTRNRIIPANRGVGIKKLLAAAQSYFNITGREVTYEYVLIDGVNAGVSQARDLARLLRPYRCSVNLIPLNPVEGIDVRPPSPEGVRAFAETVRGGGVNATVRKRRGDDISAACGQLRRTRSG